MSAGADQSRTAPTVSVIVTAYNVRPFIDQAIESVLQQTYRDYELVVVDDGSTDGSSEIIDAITDLRFRVVRQPNAGSGAARNAAISVATGEYLAFLDGDDYWAPAKLARHMAFHHAHPEVDLTFSLSKLVDYSGAVLGLMNARTSGYVSFRELLLENHIRSGSSVVVRAAALRGAGCFDTTLRACIDYDAWLRVVLLRPANAYCIAEALNFYRRREGQISSNWRRMRDAHRQLLQKLEHLSSDWQPSNGRLSECNMHRYYAYLAYESWALGDAVRLLLASFRLAPVHCLMEPRSWMMMAAIASKCILGESAHTRLEHLAFSLRSRRLARVTLRNK